MIANSAALPEFYLAYRERGEPLVLATIIETIGSTYRKPGAQMLIARDGQAAGLLSGGCAESDLIERAQRVFATWANALKLHSHTGARRENRLGRQANCQRPRIP